MCACLLHACSAWCGCVAGPQPPRPWHASIIWPPMCPFASMNAFRHGMHVRNSWAILRTHTHARACTSAAVVATPTCLAPCVCAQELGCASPSVFSSVCRSSPKAQPACAWHACLGCAGKPFFSRPPAHPGPADYNVREDVTRRSAPAAGFHGSTIKVVQLRVLFGPQCRPGCQHNPECAMCARGARL